MKPKRLGPRDLPRLLLQDPMPRLWALLGPDHDMKEEARERIGALLAARHREGFERVAPDVGSEGLDVIPVEYLVGSLFSQVKLVDIRNLDAAPAAARREFIRSLAIENLHPAIHVIITSEEREEAFGTDFVTLTFWPPRTRGEIVDWIRETCRRLDVTIHPDLPGAIHDLYGFDTGAIRQELRKAKLYVTDRPLAPEDFTRYATQASDSNIFGVMADFLGGRLAGALPGLIGLWEQGEAPARVIRMLSGQIHHVMVLTALDESHPGVLEAAFDLARQHGATHDFWRQKTLEKQVIPLVKSFVPREAFDAHLAELKPLPLVSALTLAARYGVEAARRVHRDLLELEFLLKSSGEDVELGLERVVHRISGWLNRPPVSGIEPRGSHSPRTGPGRVAAGRTGSLG